MIVEVDEIYSSELHLYSPISRYNNDIVMSCENGSIVRLHQDKSSESVGEYQLDKIFTIGGQSYGISMDDNNENRVYIADMAHQAILIREYKSNVDGEAIDGNEDGSQEVEGSTINEIIKEYNKEPFIGPNNLVISKNGDRIYFTDSGPWGETSIQDSKGSVYMIDKESGLITPLSYSCLAHPCGMVLSKDERFLYVCETGRNRILRFYLKDSCTFKYTVFYQFNGRYGPTSITEHSESSNLYVSLYEYRDFDSNGIIEVINTDGNKIFRYVVQGYPQLTYLIFNSNLMNSMIAVDQSDRTTVFSFDVKDNQSLEKSDKDRQSQY